MIFFPITYQRKWLYNAIIKQILDANLWSIQKKYKKSDPYKDFQTCCKLNNLETTLIKYLKKKLLGKKHKNENDSSEINSLNCLVCTLTYRK